MLVREENKIGADIVGIGMEYSEWLKETSLPELGDPGNIGTGAGGMILFLISLFRISNEQRHLDSIRELTSGLLEYCREDRSDDYSLYTGRGGVIYLLIQVYLLTREEEWLKAALELMEPANQVYLHSSYTSDYLFDGRAGTLLVILHLYLITKAPICLDYINQFANKIILNAQVGQEGVAWSVKDEINLKHSCGFAYGTAGIRYVLNGLNAYCGEKIIDELIRRIDRYTEACWVSSFHNWGDFTKDIYERATMEEYIRSYTKKDPALFCPANDYSWAKGTVGILFSHLGRAGKDGSAVLEKGAGVIDRHRLASGHLYDGLSGLGMYFLQTGNNLVLDKIKTSIFETLTQNGAGSPVNDLKGGLLHGGLGDVYFLLKTIEPVQGENILAPFLNQRSHAHPTIGLKIDHRECRRNWFGRYYPRTLHLIASSFPAMLQKLESEGPDAPEDPVAGVERLIGNSLLQEGRNPAGQCLADLFLLERKKRGFGLDEIRSNLEIWLSELTRRQLALQILDKPDEWLKEQTVSLSKKNVLVSTSRWNWSFADDLQNLNAEILKNLNKPPANYKYIFLSESKSQVSELFLRNDLLWLYHCFEQPKRVDTALAEIHSFLTSMPPEVLGNMLGELTAFRNVADFLAKSADTALCEIRQWIYRGILVVECRP